MLLTIGIVFIVLWLLGFTLFRGIGWIIHILLVIAVIMILISLLS